MQPHSLIQVLVKHHFARKEYFLGEVTLLELITLPYLQPYLPHFSIFNGPSLNGSLRNIELIRNGKSI